MKQFKYSMLLDGTSEKRISIQKELEKIGYKDSESRNWRDGYMTTVGSSVRGNLQDAKDDSFSDYPNRLNEDNEFDYEFNINNEWEYEAALAIASIREDDKKVFLGEWIKMSPSSSAYLGEVLSKVVQTDGDGFNTLISTEIGFRSSLDIYNQRKASPEEIIEFFKQKYANMNTKINTTSFPPPPPFDSAEKDEIKGEVVGYRIKKDDPGFKKGLELTVRTDIQGGNRGYITPVIGGPKHRVKFPDDVLSDIEWFEPIYKEISKYEILNLGSNNIKVVINSNGEINTRSTSPITKEQLSKLIDRISEVSDIDIGDYAAYFDKTIRCIRIGCMSENNMFSIDEINAVIDTYNKLNP